MTPEFTGEVHPTAELFPMLDGDELDALTESIRANGLREPIAIDGAGRLLDGRNRLVACERAGVKPEFVSVLAENADEYVLDRNVDRRHLTPGQRAMARALVWAGQGRRKHGRWARGTVDITDSRNTAEVRTWRDLLAKAGAVVDCADRAATLDSTSGLTAEQLHHYSSLPEQVMHRVDGMTLDRAFRETSDFTAQTALAEVARYRAHVAAVDQLSELSHEAATKAATVPMPEGGAPLRREDIKAIRDIAARLRAAARQLTQIVKEDDE